MVREEEFTILVADRNSHVRELIKREMTAEGYRILLAGNGREVIQQAYRHEPVDLLIMDPDLPDTDVSFLLTQIRNRIPHLPTVIHTFRSDYDSQLPVLKGDAFVEKGANSIEILKTVAGEILKKPKQRQMKSARNKDELSEKSIKT